MATKKQVKALAIMAENGGNASKAMLEAGYSPQTAKTPHKLTKSKGFIQLLDDSGVTDEKLARVLNEGLNSTKTVVMGSESKESFVDIQPDFVTRHKYLETAIKIKGHAKDGSQNGSNFIQVNNNYGDKYAD